ncbi:MAG: hypothetical protein QOG48_2071, partial [Verrucomicrobiota bacterium]
NGIAVIYFVVSNSAADVILAILRFIDHPLVPTLLRHFLYDLCQHSSAARCRTIHVTEKHLNATATSALQDTGFIPSDANWWKLSISGVVERAQLSAIIAHSSLPEQLRSSLALHDGENRDVSQIERVLSPVKIIPSGIACFVVSIKASWAAHFFDIPIGGQLLMDLNERLHLGIEGAYYCSAANRHLSAPARILWYVSGTGAMAIKACSHLDQIIVGTPKEVYAALRRLGVYSWKDVLATAGGKITGKVLAFRFSRTERFVRPIDRSTMKQMEIPQPQNPRRISEEIFGTVYNLGLGASK